MTERELQSLKHRPVPAPRPAAKAAALAAARAAFEAAGKNPNGAAQGDAAPARPTLQTSLKPRRSLMRLEPTQQAIAASIAIAFLVAPAAYLYLSTARVGYDYAAKPPEPHSADARGGAKLADKSKVALNEAPTEQAPGPIALGKDEAKAPASAAPATAVTEAAPVSRDQSSNLRPAKPVDAHESRLRNERDAAGVVAAMPNASAVPPGAAGRFRFSGDAKSVGGKLDGAVSSGIGLTDLAPIPQAEEGRDRFQHVASNPVRQVASEPVSTFSVDVDTASYAFVRRALNAGRLPPKDAVRIEELINYFSYDYPRPETAAEPFKPTVTVLPSPWNAARKLVHIAIKGYELASAERPPANLVLLIDVSGSMGPNDRLPLLKNAFKMLLDTLRPDDTVGIVTYASGSGVALEPTKVADKRKIVAAIDRLGAGGSTAGARGIEDAYRLAEQGFRKDAINRVILGTDGDFNVGITDQEELKSYIERKRKTGIYLSILGVGRGNYNDALMQALAQNGNGTAAYIDTLSEARKVLVEEASSTLFPIAKDVKIQLELNPALVSEYRLIGYETRALRREDFNNDKVDAGDVGSGHAVTAIYEITPADAKTTSVDELRYSARRTVAPAATPAGETKADEIGFLKLRYKLPAEETSRLLTTTIRASDAKASVEAASADVRFAVAVAGFGQLLQGGEWTGSFGYDDVAKLAMGAKGEDPFGLRAEFVNLVRLAKSAQP